MTGVHVEECKANGSQLGTANYGPNGTPVKQMSDDWIKHNVAAAITKQENLVANEKDCEKKKGLQKQLDDLKAAQQKMKDDPGSVTKVLTKGKVDKSTMAVTPGTVTTTTMTPFKP